MVTPIFLPARSTLAAIRSAASRVSAIGFSEMTCRPWASAASTTDSWNAGGVTTVQMSAGFSAQARCRSV